MEVCKERKCSGRERKKESYRKDVRSTDTGKKKTGGKVELN